MGERKALDVVAHFLAGLSHTGHSGFEGLTAALLEAASNQRFRLSGSGPQSGQDARSEPAHSNLIKVEAKHYGKSSLELRELHAELLQASMSSDGLDLWVLVASCPVSDQHAAALEQAGQKLDVEVLLLDLGTSEPPRLAVLMAAFPEVVAIWGAKHSKEQSNLGVALSEIALHAQFEAEKRRLISKLSGTLLGYGDARRRAAKRFKDLVRDQGTAVSILNQRVAVDSPGSRRIRRIEVDAELDLWWGAWPGAYGHGVLLGEDGTGKSWAGVGWVADRLHEDALPIVLAFSGSGETIAPAETLEGLLPQLLAKWTDIGTAASWSRRWKKWLDGPEQERPLVLILADGLNERPGISWPTFFRILEDKKWRTKVAVLATDRPAHWEQNCAKAGLDSFRPMKVDGFTDGQLRLAIEGRGIDIQTIPGELQELIRKPRYCDLVCQHYAEMQANSDFTVERLILLDIRHRAQSKRGPITEDEFIEIIKNLAKKYRENPEFTLSALQSVAPRSDPDRQIYEEIVSGGLVVRAARLSPKFTVERTKLIFGLGMLLADELESIATQGKTRVEIENELTSWFEPHPEMDLKVQICGSALFHSLLQKTYPTAARRELLLYWLTLRNWDDRVQSAFVDYVVRCPEDFIAAVPECWSSKRDLGAAQDFLARSFLKHRDNGAVQPLLAKAVRSWMGFVCATGTQYRRDQPERMEKKRAEIEARVGHALLLGSLEICGETLTVVDDPGVMRLARFGFLIVSAGDRKPFLDSFVAWAIASAVMAEQNSGPLADWVVRMSNEPIEERLSQARAALLEHGNSIARSAAHTLLWRIDPQQAEQVREQEPEHQTELWRHMTKQQQTDPCLSWFPWNDENCLRCMERSEVHPTTALQKIGNRIFAREFKVPQSFLARAAALLHFNPEKFRAALWAGPEEHFYGECMPLLASRAPNELAAFIHRVVGTVTGREFDQLYPVALWLPEVSSLLRKDEVEVILGVSERLQQQASEEADATKRHDLWIAETFLLIAAAPHITPNEILSRILHRPEEARDLSQLEPWFSSLTSEEARNAFSLLQTSTNELTLKRLLWFLVASPYELSEVERERILVLLKAPDVVLRGLAFRFIYWSEDAALRRAAMDLGDSYRQNLDQIDDLWGARVLVRNSRHLAFALLRERLNVAFAGYALRERGYLHDEVRSYAQWLDYELRTIFEAPDAEGVTLPTIEIARIESLAGGEFPRFPTESTSITFKDATATWGTSRRQLQPPLDFEEWMKDLQDPQRHTEKLNRRSKERVDTVGTAWKTQALQWFGQDFSSSALRRVCELCPDLVKGWVENAVESELSQGMLMARFATLFIRLCPGLLEHDPPTGLKLWKQLYCEKDGPVLFDGIDAAFGVPDNAATDAARWIVIGNAFDDETLSKISFLAELYAKQDWLRSAVEKLISEVPLWKRALGLTLASFSNMSVPDFEGCVRQANLGGSWVEDKISAMREQVRANQHAQYWFELYLAAEDEERSWGALQMMLGCADQRFYLWRERYETQEKVSKRRLTYLASREREIEKLLNRSEKRKDVLFGMKIERGEVFPFLDRRSVSV